MSRCILTLLWILQRLFSCREILIQFTSLSLSLNLSLQAGIGGICHARYVIQEDRKNSRIYVTRTVDLNNCQEKVQKSIGMAYIYPCPVDVMVCETWKDLPHTKQVEKMSNTSHLPHSLCALSVLL